MNKLVQSTKDDNLLKKYLGQEVQFQRMTHPKDVDARPGLYKVNIINKEELIENLIVMIGVLDSQQEEAVIFPNEDEIMAIQTRNNSQQPTSSQALFEQDEIIAVVWDEDKGKICILANMSIKMLKMDHLGSFIMKQKVLT